VSPPLDFSTFYPVLVQGKAAEMRLDTESIHLSRTQHLTGQQTQSLITMTTVSQHISTLHYTYTNKPVVSGQDIHWPCHIITRFQAHHPYLPNKLEVQVKRPSIQGLCYRDSLTVVFAYKFSFPVWFRVFCRYV